MNFNTLISCNDLQALSRAGGALVLLDCSFDLADPGAGERAYAAGHIPGAQYAHLERDLSSAKTGSNGRHPLPDAQVFAATAGCWGIAPGVQVVAYDAQGGPYASRAWWLLRWLGHAAVAVLDGGLGRWRAMGAALSTAPAVVNAVPPYPLHAHSMPAIDAQTLLAQAGQWQIVDARAPERYRGDVETIDAVAGHIPGAHNRFFKDNLEADGSFKPAAELRQAFAAFGAPGQVVHQCGSGVTACHNLLAMTHAGLEGSLLYPGSWSEWIADPTRPVARG